MAILSARLVLDCWILKHIDVWSMPSAGCLIFKDLWTAYMISHTIEYKSSIYSWLLLKKFVFKFVFFLFSSDVVKKIKYYCILIHYITKVCASKRYVRIWTEFGRFSLILSGLYWSYLKRWILGRPNVQKAGLIKLKIDKKRKKSPLKYTLFLKQSRDLKHTC